MTRTARGLIRGVHPVWWLTAAACTLRLLLFLGRGDYVAFDEGWYLLLGVNVMTGRGFTLSGLQHIALSPLFPLMAGAVNWVIDNPIWSGRIVAALTAGLLVLPCWSIAYRLAGRRTAVIMCVLIAVMPTLSAFVAAYWIGWDLWVGAEPVLHLLLFTGLALALRAWDSERVRDWLLAGIAFALAYLARPEAIIAFGVVGLITGARALLTRWPPRIAQVAALALAFALTAAPYWLYLHGAMGRWAITGRGIDVSATMRRAPATSSSVPRPPHASNTIEQMLWGSDHAPYVQHIYSLDPSGTRLSSLYWGIPLPDTVSVSRPKKSAAPDTTRATTPQPAPRPVEKTRSRLALYARALAQVIPFYLWPFMLLGVVATTRRWRTELIFVLPLVGTSVAIARVVAIDPRTQLLIVPLAAFYAARGIRRAGTYLERNVGRTRVRRGMMSAALATAVALLLLGTEARWLYFSLKLGSPHHLVGTENRRVAEALQKAVPPAAPIMSYHPALALYAKRDWRVLPQAEFKDVLRYANAIEAEYVVLSPYYPAPLRVVNNPREYILMHVPPGSADAEHWRLHAADGAHPYLSLTTARAGER